MTKKVGYGEVMHLLLRIEKSKEYHTNTYHVYHRILTGCCIILSSFVNKWILSILYNEIIISTLYSSCQLLMKYISGV